MSLNLDGINDIHIFTSPKTKSILHITSGLLVELTHVKPNRWFRFWYRVLLGWTWSDK